MQEKNFIKLIRKYCKLLCHQKPERCFKIKKFLFPICARCTGILVSFTIVLILLSLKVYVSVFTAFSMLLVMFIDWIIQFFEIKDSTNTRRFITGLIGGFGLSYIYYYTIGFIINHFL